MSAFGSGGARRTGGAYGAIKTDAYAGISAAQKLRTFPAAAFCAALIAGCATKTADIITYDSASLSNVIRVTDNRFRKDSVRVSPDGSKILYCEANVTNVDTYVSFDQFSVMLLRDANLPSKTPVVTDPSFGNMESAIDSNELKARRSGVRPFLRGLTPYAFA
jgi:hypothetical protein